MSCEADSYKKDDYQARPFAPCPVRPINTIKKTTKQGRLPHSLWPIHTRKKTTEFGRLPMACAAD